MNGVEAWASRMLTPRFRIDKALVLRRCQSWNRLRIVQLRSYLFVADIQNVADQFHLGFPILLQLVGRWLFQRPDNPYADVA